MSLQARGNALRENTNRSKENQRSRQGLKAGVTNANNKRNALGNVTNQIRRQPLRAAKDKHTLVGISKSEFEGQENRVVPSKVGGTGFSIFQDAPRVPPCGSSQDLEKPQVLSCQDVSHIDEFMLEKENFLDEHGIPEAIINLNHNIAPIAPAASHLGVLQPLRINVEDAVSPMVVDSAGRDIDEEHLRDEFGLNSYCHEIYNFMRAKELENRPGLDFMSRQTDVTVSMRNILVDWLVEVGEEYKLDRETLFLSINYIDRFLGLVRVERPKLQLVGAASMFIAAKYEEIYPPDVGEFVYITDDTYSKKQVLKMEGVILKLLEFKVASPTINWFCQHYLESLSDMNETAKMLAYFFAELSLIEIEDFLIHRSSAIAASCLVLSRSTLNIHPVWPEHLERSSGMSVREILDCVKSLYCLHKRAHMMAQQAVFEKYKQERYGRVSLIAPSSVLTLL